MQRAARSTHAETPQRSAGQLPSVTGRPTPQSEEPARRGPHVLSTCPIASPVSPGTRNHTRLRWAAILLGDLCPGFENPADFPAGTSPLPSSRAVVPRLVSRCRSELQLRSYPRLAPTAGASRAEWQAGGRCGQRHRVVSAGRPANESNSIRRPSDYFPGPS